MSKNVKKSENIKKSQKISKNHVFFFNMKILKEKKILLKKEEEKNAIPLVLPIEEISLRPKHSSPPRFRI